MIGTLINAAAIILGTLVGMPPASAARIWKPAAKL